MFFVFNCWFFLLMLFFHPSSSFDSSLLRNELTIFFEKLNFCLVWEKFISRLVEMLMYNLCRNRYHYNYWLKETLDASKPIFNTNRLPAASLKKSKFDCRTQYFFSLSSEKSISTYRTRNAVSPWTVETIKWQILIIRSIRKNHLLRVKNFTNDQKL